jgi:hypothetical protein
MDHTPRTLLVAGPAFAGAAFLVGLVNVATLLAVGRDDLLLSPDALIPLTASGIGFLVVRKVPRNAVGWLLIAAAMSSALFGASALLVMESVAAPAPVPDLAAWPSTWVWLPSYLIALPHPQRPPDDARGERHRDRGGGRRRSGDGCAGGAATPERRTDRHPHADHGRH